MKIESLICPYCKSVAFVRDDTNGLGIRRWDTAGSIRLKNGVLVLCCCKCGVSWDFGKVTVEGTSCGKT